LPASSTVPPARNPPRPQFPPRFAQGIRCCGRAPIPPPPATPWTLQAEAPREATTFQCHDFSPSRPAVRSSRPAVRVARHVRDLTIGPNPALHEADRVRKDPEGQRCPVGALQARIGQPLSDRILSGRRQRIVSFGYLFWRAESPRVLRRRSISDRLSSSRAASRAGYSPFSAQDREPRRRGGGGDPAPRADIVVRPVPAETPDAPIEVARPGRQVDERDSIAIRSQVPPHRPEHPELG
jgi:hypothetical protein